MNFEQYYAEKLAPEGWLIVSADQNQMVIKRKSDPNGGLIFLGILGLLFFVIPGIICFAIAYGSRKEETLVLTQAKVDAWIQAENKK